MRAEVHRQSQPGLSDEGFCDSDVAFHRALVDGAANPVLSYQLAGAVEAMQPLMNMITFTARSREAIIAFIPASPTRLRPMTPMGSIPPERAGPLHARLGSKAMAARAAHRR